MKKKVIMILLSTMLLGGCGEKEPISPAEQPETIT